MKKDTIRLSEACKKMNVSSSEVIVFMQKHFFVDVTLNSKLTDEQYDILCIEFASNPKIVEEAKNRNTERIEKEYQTIVKSMAIPRQFYQNNPFDEDITRLISSENIFLNRREEIVQVGNDEVVSIFSDTEAFAICRGLEDSHSKTIANNYFKSEGSDTETIEAHIIAMKALEKYGEEMLMYVLSLPTLPFKSMNVKNVFTELDKNYKKNPTLRLLYENAKGEKEKLMVHFHSEYINGEYKTNHNVIIVKNRTTNKPLMRISRDGNVIAENKAKGIIPVMKLFLKFDADIKGYSVNYGLETGDCAVCGRPLSDELSLIRGVGPVCWERMNK